MSVSSKILIFGNPGRGEVLQDYLTNDFGEVIIQSDLRYVQEVLVRDSFDLLVLYSSVDSTRADDFLRWMNENALKVPVLVICEEGDFEQATSLTRAGAEQVVQWSDQPAFFPYLSEVIRKIQAESRRKELLPESENLYRTLFENIRDAVLLFYWNEESGMPETIIEANDVACRRLEYTRKELARMTPGDIDVPGATNYELVVKGLEEKGFVVFKTVHRTRTGKEIPTEVNARFFKLGGRRAILAVARNITDQQKALEDLQKSEARFRSIIESCIIGICITDKNGLFEFVNEEYCQIYGYTPEELIGKHFTMVVPDNDKDYMSGLHDDFLLKGKEIKGNWTVVDKKGREHFIIADATRIRDASGAYKKVTFVEDVTTEKEAKSALEQSEMKYQTMMENLQDPVMISNENYEIVYVNRTFRKRFGNVKKNSKCHKEVFGLKEPCPWCMAAKENMSRFRKRLEQRIHKRDYQITTVPVVFKGAYQAKMTIFRDVTKVVRARKRAEESDRLKSAFLANISHEIRTPLNAVMGFSGLLKDEDLTRDESLMYIDMINESSEHLLHVMDDIIEFSFIDSGLVEVHPVKVKIPKLLDDLLLEAEEYQKKMNKTQLQVSFRNELPETFKLFTDESRLRQILLNLLSNAVKFTEQGGITVSVSYTDNRWVLFSVKDTGIGIPARMHKVIFRRFRQADEGHTRMFGGNGLGLALCKHLAHMLGGHIELKSRPGKGSEFLLFLPERFDQSLARALDVNMIE
ncbi:PAS domain S-box protein [Marinilabilia salmonicolor]|uniref:histidine kinase n=1 Tax=Marinilabilia salmonicolor TaxID=989 RepID=A0A368VB33_9BACT|nr:PAS domain S-box protein [Marinilabilia salmonicolor]RCW37445.1 PAS domain S-box-containing protein [Marinilabilia salmonicolor]